MGLFDFGYKRRLWFSLQDNYGRRPDPFYAAGDMSTIRSYHDYMREQEPDVFHIDDVTWSDLDMDRVFKRINPGLSTPGEQVLYHLLRTPAMDSAEYERRTQLIRFAEADEQERLETQYVLGCLGRFRRADVCRVFSPSYGGYLGMALYMILALALLCSPLSMIALRPLMALGAVPSRSSDMTADFISSALLLDLIMFEYLKNRLGVLHKEILAVFDALGRVDAAIAAASWRESMPLWCAPELDFGTGERYISAEGLVHPLLSSPVPNGLELRRPALVTGSNASGKSTYLRTCLLAALLSQSLCTCPGASYRGSAFHIYSAMALRDDLLSGESYYIAEILATKRILDAAAAGEPVLCAVDEVLRGTNTLERISAASEILQSLASSGALVVAATHDLELCAILDGNYDMLHFEEKVTDEGMSFDYRVRPGRTLTRNAIRLLRLMGLDESITQRADKRARRFLETGIWEKGEISELSN